MKGQPRSARRLAGLAFWANWRGRPPLDRETLLDAIMALESIARSSAVTELDINPLLVLPDGVRVLDAVVALR